MRKVKIGHITLRIEPEVHEELLRLSEELGVHVSSLIKVCITKCLPHLRVLANTEVGDKRCTP